MPDLILRRNVVVPAYPDEFSVILTMDDGFELLVGGIRKDTAPGPRAFWAWSGLGGNGQAKTLEEAMAAIKGAWQATDEKLAAMRQQQEWTEWKYALWDAGYRDKLGKGPLRCHCGEMFDPDDHEAIRSHIEHINAKNRGMRRP